MSALHGNHLQRDLNDLTGERIKPYVWAHPWAQTAHACPTLTDTGQQQRSRIRAQGSRGSDELTGNGRVDYDYGSEGWGFESLRARSVLRRKLGALEMSGAFGVLLKTCRSAPCRGLPGPSSRPS